jgi:hypothetical protein
MKKIYSTILLLLGFTAFIAAQTSAPPPKFLNEIQIPPLGTNPDSYDLDVIQTIHDFNPQTDNDPLNGVTTFAFEDFNNSGTTSILGPTLTMEI